MALGPCHLRGLSFLRCCRSLVCNLQSRRGVQHKFPRAHKRKVRPHSRVVAHRLSLPRNLRARRGVGRKFRRAHKRKVRAAQQSEWCIVAVSPLNLQARRGVGRKFRRAHKHKVRAHSRVVVHRRNLPRNLQPSRGVGRKFRRAHKHKVQARSRATAHRRSPPRNLRARRGVGRKFRTEPTSTRYERAAERRRIVAALLATSGLAGGWDASSAQSPQAQGTSAQQSDGASSQPSLAASGLAGEWGASSAEPTSARYERPAKQEVGGDAPEQGVAQDATSPSSTPVSRKTDPLSDTELQKDLGGSELPTSVRLSPHDIHTEITFISEDEVNVQLSLAEDAPMEISVRALAAQLTGDDAVRIEILDLPEGLRFDRETGMLEDTLGSGLSGDGVAEVRVMLTDAQGRRITVTLQVLSAEGLSQPEAATKLEGRTQTDDRTGVGGLGGGRRDVGGSSDGAGLSDEGEGSEASDSVGDAALEELSGDKEARSSSGFAGSGSGSAGALSSEGFFANFLAREACVCGVCLCPTFSWIFSGDFLLRKRSFWVETYPLLLPMEMEKFRRHLLAAAWRRKLQSWVYMGELVLLLPLCAT